MENIWSGNYEAEAWFRKTITLKTRPKTAFLRIFVDPGYELFINGRLVATLNEWANTRDYDVRVFLQEGENLLAVHGISYGDGHRALALALACDDEIVAETDASWKAFAGGERFGWMTSNFDDSDWTPATEYDMSGFAGPQWTGIPGDGKFPVIPVCENSLFFTDGIPKAVDSPYYMKKEEQFVPSQDVIDVVGQEYRDFSTAPLPKYSSPVAVTHGFTADGTLKMAGDTIVVSAPSVHSGPSLVADFGRETMGYFRIRKDAGKPINLRLYYGENLGEILNPLPTNRRNCRRMLIEDVYLHDGIQEFESRRRVGFRFVRVEFICSDGEATFSNMGVRWALYPVQNRGWFKCNDNLLNRCWDASRLSVHYNMQDFYLDAIKRDRLCWVGDTRASALYNYYLFRDEELLEFTQCMMAKCQYPDGSIPSSFGVGLSLLWDYVCWWVITFYDHALYTGKKDLLAEHKLHICRAVDWMTSKTDPEDGLMVVPANVHKVWMVIHNFSVGKDLFINRLYDWCLDIARTACEITGDNVAAETYKSLREKTHASLQKLEKTADLTDTKANFFNSTGRMEIILDMFKRKGDNGKKAVDDIRATWGKMLTETQSDTLFEGLYCDDPDCHYPSIFDNSPNDGSMISYCHAWTGCPAYLLPGWVAGITPATPGFETFYVKPQLADLTDVKAVVPTPHGEIAVHYPDQNSLIIRVPQGTTALVHDQKGGLIGEFAAGIHEIKLA